MFIYFINLEIAGSKYFHNWSFLFCDCCNFFLSTVQIFLDLVAYVHWKDWFIFIFNIIKEN